MKTECTSRLAFLNPHILISFALYAAGVVLALPPMSSAVAADNAAAELSPSSQAHPPGRLEVSGSLPGRWIGTGDLTTARYRHTATLLENGQVLVAGGLGLASTELYDPATGVWTPTGSMNKARQYHTATLLTNGQVLVAGGGSGGSSTAELYDPATGMWTRTGSMTPAREFHTATLLPNGKVLVAGGLDPLFHAVGTAGLYDPATGMWTQTGSAATGR
jgi:Galactose oxidase, central domain